MSVTNRKLFNRGARDELRRKGGIMASSEPMMQAVGYANGGGVDDQLMQYLASLKPRFQGGAVPGGSFPTNTVYDPDPAPQIPVAPTYDMTQFGSLDLPKVTGGYQGVPVINFFDRSGEPPEYTEPDDIGDIIAAEGGPTSDEGIRARVAESAAQGKEAAKIADKFGLPIQEALDIVAGLASAGLLETGALASDIMSSFQSGVMGNQDAGEFYARIARGIKNYSDENYYNEGDFFPRVSAGLTTEDDKQAAIEAAAEQERLDAIRQASLANIGSADMEGADTGVFADTGDSIPVSSDSLGQEAIKERIISDYLGREPIKVGRTFPTGSRLNQFGGQLNRPDDMALYSSDSDLVRQGVASILPGLVNEPPAEVPQTIEQKIANTLANIATGGVEKAGEFFEGGTEYLEGLISGDDTPVATELSGIQEKQRQDAIRKYLGEESEYQIPGIVDDVDKGYFDTNRVKEDNFGSRDSLYFNIDPIASDVNKRALEYLQSDMYTPPEEIYGDTSVFEELTTTAGELTSKLTKKAEDAIDAVKKNFESPEGEQNIPNTGQAPTLENDDPVATVELDSETANEPILTDKTANDLFGGDTNLTTTITKLTKGDVGNMKDDLSNVTDDESFESYVSKYVKQYQELFKEDEDQIRKDKGFALAIFGSVYGSTGDWGQASAAMIDMLRGDKATRQARTDKVKMLAINSAADRAAADLRYKREIDVASARGGSSIYGKRTDPLTQTYRLTSDFLNAGDYDTYNEAFEAAKKQVEKEYGISLGASADIEKPDPEIQKLITNQRENKVSDEVIKKQLEAAGYNTNVYGF